MWEREGGAVYEKGEESDWVTLLSVPQSKREMVEHTH